jgi:long-chain acyl-CoA synthetase
MEAGTATAHSTGSKTIADLIGQAALKHAEHVAVRHKAGGAWQDVTYAQVGEIVSEVGRGLIDLGVQPGERVCILCDTRPEWTYADFAISSAGGVVVPIYPTNSPEECEWVAGNSESVGVVCENAEQVAKIVAVRERLPQLRFIVAVDASGDVADAVSFDDLRARGRGRDAAPL